MARKKQVVKTQHQINGREVLEAINAIAFSQNIEQSELLSILEKNIHDVLVRRNYDLRHANVEVSFDMNGNLHINRVYKIVPEYSDTYKENCQEITQDDILELLEKYVVDGDEEKTKLKQQEYVKVTNETVYEKIDFKFERKLFDDLRSVTKGKILATSKENRFNDIRYELSFFKARITNIRKQNIYLSYKDVEFILPFTEFDKHDSPRNYHIGDFISVSFLKEEKTNTSLRLFVTKKAECIVPTVFKQYKIIGKESQFELKTVSPLFNKKGYKLFITSKNLSADFIKQYILKHKNIAKVKQALEMSPAHNFLFLVSNSVTEFIIQFYQNKVVIQNISIDEDSNQYDLIVSTDTDKVTALKELKNLRIYTKKMFDQTINLNVLTSSEYHVQQEKENKELINNLMKNLHTHNLVAELLFEYQFDTVEDVYLADHVEFEPIKFQLEEYGLTIDELKEKASKYVNTHLDKYKDNENSNLNGLSLSENEIQILSKNYNINTIQELADLDMYEVMDILLVDKNRAKKIVLEARGLE